MINATTRKGSTHGTLQRLHDQAPETEKVHGPTHDGEKIRHIVPEDDPDTALCGKDVTGWPWNPPWPYCVVCLDLAGYGDQP